MDTFTPGPARPRRDLDVFLALGGWGDGPGRLPMGSRIYLIKEAKGGVVYLSGWREPRIGEPRTGGDFRQVDLAHVEAVTPAAEDLEQELAGLPPEQRKLFHP